MLIPLHRELFSARPTTIVSSGDLEVTAARYASGIESLKITNRRGFIEILPFFGQIIWDAQFDGISLRMTNMFRQPQPCTDITGTYGCFAFHSGLLAAGCPAPDDDHELHGEFPCARMDSAHLELTENAVRVESEYEYVRGFGHHYCATPSVRLASDAALFEIDLTVTNLSAHAPMPLQYMCHLNYAFVPGGIMRQTIPDGAFQLRRTVPAHVTPTPRWREINEQILAGSIDPDGLSIAEEFDPEIVYFADDLPRWGKRLEFCLTSPTGHTFTTQFDSDEFPVATRWILSNPDQRVAAFVLPGTSRPEGRNAARASHTLVSLAPGHQRSFHVTTGLKD